MTTESTLHKVQYIIILKDLVEFIRGNSDLNLILLSQTNKIPLSLIEVEDQYFIYDEDRIFPSQCVVAVSYSIMEMVNC